MMAFPGAVKGSICVEVLDCLRSHFGFSSDTELAKLLDISPGHLSSIRNGHREMSTKLLLKCFDALGLEVVRAALLAVSPGQIRSSLELVKKGGGS